VQEGEANDRFWTMLFFSTDLLWRFNVVMWCFVTKSFSLFYVSFISANCSFTSTWYIVRLLVSLYCTVAPAVCSGNGGCAENLNCRAKPYFHCWKPGIPPTERLFPAERCGRSTTIQLSVDSSSSSSSRSSSSWMIAWIGAVAHQRDRCEQTQPGCSETRPPCNLRPFSFPILLIFITGRSVPISDAVWRPKFSSRVAWLKGYDLSK